MLALTDSDDADAGPRKGTPERLCIATREVKPVDDLIRFVVGPEGVVPDLKRRLPGRGVWVTARRGVLISAVKRKAFAKSFKQDVAVPSDLVALTERMLERAALDSLGIAHKARAVAAGHAKAEAALANDRVVALIHAADASPDGVRKLAAAAHRRFGEDGVTTISLFSSAQLDLALGRSNVVHAALLAGPASDGFLARCRSLERFRAEDGSTGGGGTRGRGLLKAPHRGHE